MFGDSGEDSGYGPFLTRRGRGNVLTHFLTAVLGAGLAVILLLLFFSPASSESMPGGYAVPSPAPSSAPLAADGLKRTLRRGCLLACLLLLHGIAYRVVVDR